MMQFAVDVPILIPAYKPGESLAVLIHALLELGARNIVVVNDGSGPEFQDVFRAISIQIGRAHV